MGLDRDELAARCLASMLSCSGRTGRASDYAEDAVDAADALLSALSPPAAVAPATPAPEAKRPGWVRVTGPSNATHVTVGKVYAVVDWDATCERLVIRNDGGARWLLSNKPCEGTAFPTWEPCDAPAPTPPAPSREEALAMALREVRRMVEGGVYRATITTYIDATLSRPAATKGGA